ncbi:MAG: DUF3365 domain-containing protein, partial [Epsilonproteobacteria bacterium]|nr:DUF3365 domain-containing protein [Campylobacterota bacterium]
MKSLKKQIHFTIFLSAVGLIILIGSLYVGINKFLVLQEVSKARSVADTIIAFRNFLAKAAPKVEVKDKNASVFMCTPAYVTNQATKILREKEHFYVRQVSDEYRNSSDKPNPAELAAIEFFKHHKDKKELWEVHTPHNSSAHVKSLSDIHIFYAKPLVAKKACLKCHGVPGKDVPPKLYEKLVKYYGKRAFGYKEGDIRGILSIVIPYKDVLKDVNYMFIRMVGLLVIGFVLGTFIFFRLTSKIEHTIEEILKYFRDEVSKRIYKPLKTQMEFVEFEKLREEINRTIKTIKNYKGEVYKKLYYHPLTGLPNRVKFFEAINLKE